MAARLSTSLEPNGDPIAWAEKTFRDRGGGLAVHTYGTGGRPRSSRLRTLSALPAVKVFSLGQCQQLTIDSAMECNLGVVNKATWFVLSVASGTRAVEPHWTLALDELCRSAMLVEGWFEWERLSEKPQPEVPLAPPQ